MEFWDLQVIGGGLPGVELGLLHVDREVRGFGDFEAFLFTSIGDVHIAFEREDAFLSWHIEYQVHVVRYSHEFGERWSTKDGVIGAFEVRDHKIDIVDAEVIGRAELHRECDLPKRHRALSGENAPKLCVIRSEVGLS